MARQPHERGEDEASGDNPIGQRRGQREQEREPQCHPCPGPGADQREGQESRIATDGSQLSEREVDAADEAVDERVGGREQGIDGDRGQRRQTCCRPTASARGSVATSEALAIGSGSAAIPSRSSQKRFRCAGALPRAGRPRWSRRRSSPSPATPGRQQRSGIRQSDSGVPGSRANGMRTHAFALASEAVRTISSAVPEALSAGTMLRQIRARRRRRRHRRKRTSKRGQLRRDSARRSCARVAPKPTGTQRAVPWGQTRRALTPADHST